DMTERECQGLDDVIAYAVNSRKTEQHKENSDVLERFVSGVNCHPATARAEMLSVKKRFGKEDGTIAYHGYQSFAPGEATPEMAHKIGVELAQRLWGNRYQVVVSTHLDKENHLHNHFVLNTVSFVDGIKYHRTAKDYHEMQAVSDALCREFGLSVIENPQPGKSKHYGEWRAEQEQRPTWRGIVRSDVDEVIRQSMTERQFFENLHRKGYEVKVGKDISVRPPGKERFVRLARNFGEDYTLDGIRRRILERPRAVRPLAEPAPNTKHYRVSGNWQSCKRVTGFRALYFHYCYLLGVFPKQKTQNQKWLHFLLREDLIKLDAITQEARLLAVHRIDTAEQLSSYQSELESRIADMTSQRKQLCRKLRTVAVKSDETVSAEVSTAIATLSRELSQLRREVKLCSDIAVRSGILPERIQKVHEDEQSQGKEKNEHDQFRRCGRANR
ncbi:MAG: relaxase/mobilization nuclease domain-containing protein, partial [Faecousia sp.]